MFVEIYLENQRSIGKTDTGLGGCHWTRNKTG
jgi:hypothetical protein